MLIFVRLIFVAAIDYENIFTTKISRFTVLLYNIHIVLSKKSTVFPWLTIGSTTVRTGGNLLALFVDFL